MRPVVIGEKVFLGLRSNPDARLKLARPLARYINELHYGQESCGLGVSSLFSTISDKFPIFLHLDCAIFSGIAYNSHFKISDLYIVLLLVGDDPDDDGGPDNPGNPFILQHKLCLISYAPARANDGSVNLRCDSVVLFPPMVSRAIGLHVLLAFILSNLWFVIGGRIQSILLYSGIRECFLVSSLFEQYHPYPAASRRDCDVWHSPPKSAGDNYSHRLLTDG